MSVDFIKSQIMYDVDDLQTDMEKFEYLMELHKWIEHRTQVAYVKLAVPTAEREPNDGDTTA